MDGYFGKMPCHIHVFQSHWDFEWEKYLVVFIRNTIVILANVAFEVNCKIFEYTKNISISETASFLIQYT